MLVVGGLATLRIVATTGPIDLGVFEPLDGHLTIRMEVVGGNPRSEGTKSFYGLDCVVVTSEH